MRYEPKQDSERKFSIPRALKGELTRSSLVEEIERASDLSVLIFSAPIGFGKTTTLAQWARATDSSVAWLTLDEEDANPSTLARSLGSSIKTAAPWLNLERFEASLDHPIPEVSAQALAEDLNDSASNLRMVLDQAQHLGLEAARWMEAFCTGLAEGHQVILSSYSEPKLRLGRMLAQGRVRILSPEQLLFSLEETEAYLASFGYQGDAKEVHRRLNGWPAGLALVGRGVSVQTAPEKLIHEMLDTLDAKLLASLPELSVLEVWSEAHAEDLGVALPAGWLEGLRDAGLPMVPVADGIYRPHTLLLQALDVRLRKRPARRRELFRLAAQLAEQAGNLLSAIRHYLKAKCFDDARRLAEQVIPQLEVRWEFGLVQQVLGEFPENHLSEGLGWALVVAYIEQGQPQRGETLAQKLSAAGISDRRGYFALGLCAVRKCDYEQVARLAEQGLAQGGNDLLENRLRRALANASCFLGDFERALELAQGCVAWAESKGDLLELAKSKEILGAVLCELGRQGEAKPLFLQALHIFRELNLSAGQVGLYLSLAELYRLSNQPREAVRYLDQALALLEGESSRNSPHAWESKADAYLWLGEFALARDCLLMALEKNADFSFWMYEQRISYKLAEVCCHLGDLEGAEAWVTRARAVPLSAKHEVEAKALFYEAIYAYYKGQPERAKELFEAALRLPLPPDRVVRSHFYLAEIARREGRLDATRVRNLNQAIERLGTAGVLGTDAPALGRALEAMLPLGLPQAYYDMALGVGVSREKPTRPNLQVVVTTLGGFAVELEGASIRVPNSKAREILAWLALNGAGSRGQIVDALWDGSNDYRHIDYFKISVRRLRAALAGHPLMDFDPVPFEDGIYRLSKRFEVKVDVLELERLLALGKPEDLEKAIDLYRGPFLPEAEAGWVEPIRTRALDAALAAAGSLGEILAQENPSRAAWAFQKLVELDPLAEASYIKLLRVLRRLGDDRRAKVVYRALVRMLNDEYGAEPDPALTREFGDWVR